jgi:hypothetical protein
VTPSRNLRKDKGWLKEDGQASEIPRKRVENRQAGGNSE